MAEQNGLNVKINVIGRGVVLAELEMGMADLDDVLKAVLEARV